MVIVYIGLTEKNFPIFHRSWDKPYYAAFNVVLTDLFQLNLKGDLDKKVNPFFDFLLPVLELTPEYVCVWVILLLAS